MSEDKPDAPSELPRELTSPNEVRTEKLEVQDLVRYTEFINLKSTQPNDGCLVCGSINSVVVQTVYRLDVMMEPPVFDPSHMPIVAVVCRDCGFTRLFNRIIVDNITDQAGSVEGANGATQG